MENRNSGRISVGKTFRCTSARRVFDAYVYNVSKSGCMIEVPGARMSEGSLVALRFTEPAATDGKVVGTPARMPGCVSQPRFTMP
ncbi:PilZ domain-containing protein [Croceicoccus mobilis]|nr:PilZ domain-containing protein [Croceicoccus mobilis]